MYYQLSPEDPDYLDSLWVEYNEYAVSAFFQGEHILAKEQWQMAKYLSETFDEGDPRLACSINNLSVGFLLNNEIQNAEKGFIEAMQLWEMAGDWIAKMELPQKARSSLFHLRMEQKFKEKYDQISKKKYFKILKAGYAGTLENLAELLHLIGRKDETARLIEEAHQFRLSASDNDERELSDVQKENLNIIRNKTKKDHKKRFKNHSESIYPFSNHAQKRGWIIDHPPIFTDVGRLMSAILLTCLVNDHICVGYLSVG